MTPYNIERAKKKEFDDNWDDYEDIDIPYDDDEDNMWDEKEDYEDYEEYYD